jgi:DNA-binding MarR family transcriptional regulator
MIDLNNDAAHEFHRSVLKLLRELRMTRSPGELTASKLLILGRLHGNDPMTASDLAAYLRIRPQSLTRQIAELERLRYIVRKPNGSDPRQNDIRITEAGTKTLLDHLKNQQNRFARALEQELSSVEQDILRIAAVLIDRIARTLEEQNRS